MVKLVTFKQNENIPYTPPAAKGPEKIYSPSIDALIREKNRSKYNTAFELYDQETRLERVCDYTIEFLIAFFLFSAVNLAIRSKKYFLKLFKTI